MSECKKNNYIDTLQEDKTDNLQDYKKTGRF